MNCNCGTCQPQFFPQHQFIPQFFPPPCPPINRHSIELPPSILSFSSNSVAYTTTANAYYSIGVGNSVVSTSAPGTSNLNLIPFLLPRDIRITRVVAKYTILGLAATTITNLSVTFQLYSASPTSNGSIPSYSSIFTQQFNNLSGSITPGSTYTIESNSNILVAKDCSLIAVFIVGNTVAENIDLSFSAAVLYC